MRLSAIGLLALSLQPPLCHPDRSRGLLLAQWNELGKAKGIYAPERRRTHHRVAETARTIAVVGLTDSPFRPSFSVSQYMRSQGYRIIPVNPNITEWMGEKAYPSLLNVPDKIDIVDVFRRSDAVPEIVEQAMEVKAPAIWLQEGVIHEEAAEKARQAGIFVVMDRCILKEHRNRRM